MNSGLSHKIIKIFGEKWLGPIILTSLVFFLSLFGLKEITVACVALFFMVCGFQLLLGVYDKLDFSIVRIERKKRRTERVLLKWGVHARFSLALAPVFYLLSPVVAWVYLALHIIVFSKVLVRLAARIINRKKIYKNTLIDLEGYQPEIAVYVTGMREVAYQINQWLPVLERQNVKVMIIAREAIIFDDMPDTPIPVFTAKSQRELEILLGECSSMRTVLYPANTMKNVQALRYFKLNHYFINHGESDKAVNQSKFLMAYDKLLLAGPLSKRRLQDAGLPLRDDQIEYVGRPQAELLLEAVSDEGVADVNTILYAPTWEGYVKNVDYSSIGPLGYELCKDILESGQYKLLFKPHPYTGKVSGKKKQELERIKSLFEHHDVPVYDDNASLHKLMNESDLLICDISSVLNEYLITKKPIILCNVDKKEKNEFLEEFPSARAATLLDLGQEVLDVIQGIATKDEQRQERAHVRSESLGDFPEGAMTRFSKVLENSLSEQSKSTGEEC
ncbi:CDP-glycerol glycerophosphotransferase family protein [Halomonas icarae]|uniref:Uncharacterized protein n=1 Tax=Halomonas icarae TaxID=2691040 RepID=A0A7X5AM18_9GAMM|nr:CDP-glycerol glycerophosphotransferase family protein [Halomonas icarae]MDR5902781.1 CDP-glycerol glycerophosphotransferase family protein [Halomonas icarae]NAW13336.1 hypothetical protein [Halomonas icarae]